MKDKDRSYKKGKESTIGKIIYGFLLFMPLIAIGTSILVNTFNIDAKNEAQITYAYETNELYTIDDFKKGNIYAYDNRVTGLYPSDYLQDGNITIKGKILYEYSDTTYAEDDFYTENSHVDYLTFNSNDTIYISIQTPLVSEFHNNENIMIGIDGNTINSFQYIIFEFDQIDTSAAYSFNQNIFFSECCRKVTEEELQEYNYIKKVEQKNITNVFYDAINTAEESQLFNWSKNSIVYTTLLATCTQLSITTTFIPMLLAYWLIISVIYILYDLALIMLHIFHKKVHCIEDAV